MLGPARCNEWPRVPKMLPLESYSASPEEGDELSVARPHQRGDVRMS